mgnify:CR=1 FL=1
MFLRNERDIFGTITSSYYSNVNLRIHYFTFENAFISWNLNQDTLNINHKKKDMNLKSFFKKSIISKFGSANGLYPKRTKEKYLT